MRKEIGTIWKDGRKWKLQLSAHIETFTTKTKAIEFLTKSLKLDSPWTK